MKDMKNIKTGTYFYNDESYNFNFGTDLSIADKQSFVNSVAEVVANDLERTYNSILRDLIFDFYVIEFFTDIDTTNFKNSPFFVDEVEQFLEESNIVEIVKANVVPTLFDELNNAVDKSIEYITGIHPSPIADSIASLLSTLERKINEFDMGSMMDMAQKLASMTGELNVDNIVKAYVESDIHKGNLEEIVKAKAERTEIAENLDKAIKEVNEENKTKKKSTKSKSKKIQKEETEDKSEKEIIVGVVNEE